MEEIYRGENEFELEHVEPVCPSEDHCVLYQYPIDDTLVNNPPHPIIHEHVWDNKHVRLPFCNHGNPESWDAIKAALLKPIKNSHQLEEAISKYNGHNRKFDFHALHYLFEEEMDAREVTMFFNEQLPRIIRLALRLPELVKAPIPLLLQEKNRSISLTQQQISCLLANAFLCTFPERDMFDMAVEYHDFPTINFNVLFACSSRQSSEKIKCILNYFARVCPSQSIKAPTGVVTFIRRYLPTENLFWIECNDLIACAPLHVTNEGSIEDSVGLLQVDFANKLIGGGVLQEGSVQEEILFVIRPELIVARLFTECMLNLEAVVIVGAERYNDYTGYGHSFEWAGNHNDTLPRDSSRRRQTHIVAMDSFNLSSFPRTVQYKKSIMVREMNKAYVGFYHPLTSAAPGVATGNWGCGAYGGDARLKALLQLMACAANQRPMLYYTFGKADLCRDLRQIYTFLVDRDTTVRDLWIALQVEAKKSEFEPTSLYQHICKYFDNIEEPKKCCVCM